jgi:hypothetical protein|tara:strand:+ start:2606 stop:3010 length:405 start_codon:yes stop_codon:yes gene_type:complete
MKGTDLTSSITAVHIILITGSFEVLPNARITPNGNEIAIPKKANNHVNVNPPYIDEPGTTIKDSDEAPLIRKISITTAAVQTIDRFFTDSFELAIVGAIDINIQVIKNNIFNCLSTGVNNITTDKNNNPYLIIL